MKYRRNRENLGQAHAVGKKAAALVTEAHGLRAQIVPAQRRRGSPQAQGDTEGRSVVRPVAMNWAQRLKRVFDIEILLRRRNKTSRLAITAAGR